MADHEIIGDRAILDDIGDTMSSEVSAMAIEMKRAITTNTFLSDCAYPQPALVWSLDLDLRSESGNVFRGESRNGTIDSSHVEKSPFSLWSGQPAGVQPTGCSRIVAYVST